MQNKIIDWLYDLAWTCSVQACRMLQMNSERMHVFNVYTMHWQYIIPEGSFVFVLYTRAMHIFWCISLDTPCWHCLYIPFWEGNSCIEVGTFLVKKKDSVLFTFSYEIFGYTHCFCILKVNQYGSHTHHSLVLIWM